MYSLAPRLARRLPFSHLNRAASARISLIRGDVRRVTSKATNADQASSSSESSSKQDSLSSSSASASIEYALEPRLSLTFTCTAESCTTRSSHTFTKRAYERGIVLVQCPGCKNRHLIADHLGWFKESTEDGKLKTVEDLMRAKGETVRRGRVGEGETLELIE